MRHTFAIAGTILLLTLATSAPSNAQVPDTQVKTPPSKAATPIEIPGKRRPVVKKEPSKGATPIEIPGKRKPVVKKKPSKGATPIEIPGPPPKY